ncbi:ribonuclease III [Paraferrimonas haliotis]|uniref:Ribonuclease 3 n=1 Tax=Paraferrimonas haliotis TaxID=2013866 RepID=A0AA37TJX6_9GAMM|nr:ribonuclease 3 [Paraferrimonas haliotis]
MADLKKLTKTIDYQFNDIEHLKLALTHRSASSRHNERLEFLGDSILSIIISEALYQKFPKVDEGALTRMRSSLVKGDTLAEIGVEFGLGEFINLGAGELKSGGFRRSSILADAVEAIIGAIYLDSDFDTIRRILLSWYQQRLASIQPVLQKDPKTLLQEYLQGRGKALPIYRVVEVTGESHKQQFKVECEVTEINSPVIATGSSRRKAEQIAAAKVMEQINGH